MPTLESIRVHEEVRRVLNEVADPPITTPQALLSRDPSNLAAVLQVPTLAPVDELRGAVADALISTTQYGKRALYVTASSSSNNSDDSNGPLIVGATTALDLLQYQQSKSRLLDGTSSCISSACQSLDTLLSGGSSFGAAGGLQFGCVTQLTGPPGSCKTQTCLWFAKMYASTKSKVFYFASSFGGHTQTSLLRRLTQLLNQTNYETILRNVHIRNVSNSQELLLELQRLMVRDDIMPSLVILDSASGCLSSDLYQQNDMTVHQVATALRTLARHYGMAVLITNGTVSGESGPKPAMGQKWDVADVHLWLEDHQEAAVNQQQDEPLVMSPRKIVRATLLEDRIGEAHRGSETTSVGQFAVTVQGISDVVNQ